MFGKEVDRLKLKRRWFISIMALLMGLMVACSSNSSTDQESLVEKNRRGLNEKQSKSPNSNQNKPKQESIKKAEELERKNTYQARLWIDVDDYSKSRHRLEKLVQKTQGDLVVSREYQNQKHTYTGTFTYRVRQGHFQTLINDLKTISLGRAQITIKGNDVTDEWVDLNARLKAKKATEKRLLKLLDQAKETRSLLEISGKLDQVQVEIEQIEGQRNHFKNRMDFSEVTVTLTQKEIVSAPDHNCWF